MTTNPVKDHSDPDFDPDDGAIFEGVIFELDPNISSSEQSKLKKQLLDHGAKYYDDEKNNVEPIGLATHYITYRSSHANKKACSVTPLWVTAAIRNGFVHDPIFYPPDPSKHFSGMVVTTSGIPKRDQEAIFGAASALGGQYRENLTSDVTHLVCLAPEGGMYDEAMGPLLGKIKVILPHWFDECFKLRRLVPEIAYLFPDPSFLQQPATSNSNQTTVSNESSAISSLNEQLDDTKNRHGTEQQNTGLSRSNSNTSMEIDTIAKNKDSTNRNDNSTADDGPMVYSIPPINILKTLVPKERYFDGKLIYLHSDVGLAPDVHACLVQHLETAGATMTNNFDDIKDHDAAIAIFKYRNSDQYWETCKRPGVVVANLAWVINTLKRGHVESPSRSICNYPVPYGGIVGMQDMVATISGYEGEARNILFHICAMVGLPCISELNQATTHLICSKRGTRKYRSGRNHNCNVVNHLWVEECYQQWQLKSVADERYTYFPPNNILQTLVGMTPLTNDNLEPWLDKTTCPPVAPYVPMHHLLQRSPSPGNSPSTSSNSTETARYRRQAALDANSHLRDVYIPDMNNYQDEQRAGNNHRSPSPSTTKPSTENTGNQRRRYSVSSPSPSSPSAPAPKRIKLDSMKSKSASSSSSKQATLTPPSPPKSSTKKPSRQPSTKRSTQSSAEESIEDDELIDDEEMTNATSPASSDQKSPTPSLFMFAETPSKIATTSCELTKDEEKGIRKLGATHVDDIRKADILVVPDRVLRTPKFLCAVNLGTTIVGYQWLKDSVANNSWCNPAEYQVKDAAMEKSHSFRLFDSLLRAQKANQLVGNNKGAKGSRHGNWLQGYEVCVLPSAGSVQQLKDVVETAGGKIVPVPKRRSRGGSSSQGNIDDTSNSLLALADKKDKKRKGWSDLLEMGAKVCDKEMIIVGALRQELALDEFDLA